MLARVALEAVALNFEGAIAVEEIFAVGLRVGIGIHALQVAGPLPVRLLSQSVVKSHSVSIANSKY